MFTENSHRNLEIFSCNTVNSPLSLCPPSFSCLARFCVHPPPQPPVPPAPLSPGNSTQDPHFDWNLTPLWGARKEMAGGDDIWLSPIGLSLFPGSLWWQLCISLPGYWVCWQKRVRVGKVKSKTRACGKVLGMWGLTISFTGESPELQGLSRSIGMDLNCGDLVHFHCQINSPSSSPG